MHWMDVDELDSAGQLLNQYGSVPPETHEAACEPQEVKLAFTGGQPG